MRTENIVKFLQTAYTDQRLADLLAHCQDGKLSFKSCCCLIGITNAPHVLRGYMPEFDLGSPLPQESKHMLIVRHNSPLAECAEKEFYWLGCSDVERTERLLPLIESEIHRRAQITIDAKIFLEVTA